MKAVIKTGGKQYRVEEGTVIYVEKLDAEVGEEVVFDEVLMANDVVGTPTVNGATVTGTASDGNKFYENVDGKISEDLIDPVAPIASRTEDDNYYTETNKELVVDAIDGIKSNDYNGKQEDEAKSVLDVIEPIERGISYTSDDILLDTGIPMLNLACYDKQGEYRVGEFKFFSGKISQKAYAFAMFIACTDMTQNADIIGRPIFAPTEYNEYVYSMDLAKITPKTISKMYLYYTLRTSFYHKYIKPFASGTNVKHLNIKGIEKYPIPIPNKDIQDKFEKIIKPIKEKQQECLKEIQKLITLRDELLPMLMNGQVEVK